MAKVRVYKGKIYDVMTDESRVSRRMATEKGAAKMRGEIIPESGVEIDEDRLEPDGRMDSAQFYAIGG